MKADVPFADCAECRIRDRMAERVRVRVPVEACVVRDIDPAEDEFASADEPVNVIADAEEIHEFVRALTIIITIPAAFARSWRRRKTCRDSPARVSIFTEPPADSTRRIPAAMSQRLTDCSI